MITAFNVSKRLVAQLASNPFLATLAEAKLPKAWNFFLGYDASTKLTEKSCPMLLVLPESLAEVQAETSNMIGVTVVSCLICPEITVMGTNTSLVGQATGMATSPNTGNVRGKVQIMQGLSLQDEVFRQILACAANLSLGLTRADFQTETNTDNFPLVIQATTLMFKAPRPMGARLRG